MRRLLAAAALWLAACGPSVEATALDGTPLQRVEPSAEARARHTDELAEARRRWEAAGEEDDAIWVGRQLAYLGRYRDAIDWYTARLEDFPRSARLLRHRGHRYLSVREYARAAADLERAWSLVEGRPDRVEADGLPNAAGIPRSTLQSNVTYHLGLAYWLLGELERAEEAWNRCVALSTNDDMLVSALNWHVHALRRLGRSDEAARALELVQPEMDVIENHAYHQLLLLQKGLADPAVVLDAGAADGVQDATVAYGVSLWHLVNGEHEEAERLWRAVVADTPWNAFGHLGAEAELARLERDR